MIYSSEIDYLRWVRDDYALDHPHSPGRKALQHLESEGLVELQEWKSDGGMTGFSITLTGIGEYALQRDEALRAAKLPNGHDRT